MPLSCMTCAEFGSPRDICKLLQDLFTQRLDNTGSWFDFLPVEWLKPHIRPGLRH